jgi:hypothetical protein
MRCGSLRAFQKYIVVRVGADTHPLGGLYPNAPIADCAQCGCNFAIASIKPGAADDFFVFCKNIPAYAQLHVRVQNGHQKYLRWLSLRTEQGGNQDVGIEDNPDHCS